MNHTNYFKKTIKIFANAPLESDTKALIELLENEDVPKVTCTFLILIVPLAFTRVICKDFDIDFLDEYEEHNPNGTVNKCYLSKNDLYLDIYNLSVDFIKNIHNNELVFKIAVASPEFQIVNDELLKNADVKKIKFSSLKLLF